MKVRFIIVLLIFFSKLSAQDTSLYQRHLLVKGSDSLPYRLLLPDNYDASKKYPLILFLHGSGERGNDNNLQLKHCAAFFVRDSIRRNYPAIVVFPQCSARDNWNSLVFSFDTSFTRSSFEYIHDSTPTRSMQMVIRLLSSLQHNYSVDKNRIYVGGLSMGGMATFEIANRKPKLFAAAFPICGGGDPASASRIKKINWWIFHGMKDKLVPAELSKIMAEAIQAKGGSVKLSLYPNAGHFVWDIAFSEPNLMQWLFDQQK